MPQLPSADTFPTATPQPVAAIPSAGLANVEAVPRAIQGLGQTITKGAGQLLDVHDDIAESHAISKFYQDKVAADQAIKNEPDPSKWQAIYTGMLQKSVDEGSAGIANVSRRARFQSYVGSYHMARAIEAIGAQAQAKMADNGKAALDATAYANLDSALREPDPTARMAIMNATNQATDAAANAGFISKDEAVHRKQAWAQTFAENYGKSLSPEEIVRQLGPILGKTAAPITGAAPAAAGSGGSTDNNVGNIRASPTSFKKFATPEEGVAAAVKLLRGPLYADKSLAEVISIWAPPKENDTKKYIDALSAATGIPRDMPLPLNDPAKMGDFVREMARIEKGKRFASIPDSAFRAGAEAAINGTPLPAGSINVNPIPEPHALVANAPALATPGENVVPFRKTGTWTDLLHPDQLRELYVKADNEIRTEQARARADQLRADAQNRADAEDTMRDEVAKIADTGKGQTVTAGYLSSIGYTPKEVDARMRQYQHAYDLFTTDQNVGLSSRTDDQKILDAGARTDPNAPTEGYAETRQMAALKAKMVIEKWRQIGEDSGGYLARHAPDYVAAIDAAIQDPSKMQPAIALADQYYDKLQVPQEQREYLPKAQAASLVKNILSAPADKRGEAVRGMADAYGQAWPQVFGSMVKAGLPPDYKTLALLKDPTAIAAMSMMLGDDKGLAMKAISGADIKAVDDKTNGLDANENLKQLGRTLDYASNGADAFAELKSGVRTLALGLIWQQHMSPSQAINKAVAAVTTDKYDFVGNARVPKGMGGQVQSAMSAAVDGLKPSDLVALPNTLMPGKLTDPQLQQTALDNARAGSMRTNERDNGVVLYGINGYPVLLTSRAGPRRMELFFRDAASWPVPGPPVARAGSAGFSGRPAGQQRPAPPVVAGEGQP